MMNACPCSIGRPLARLPVAAILALSLALPARPSSAEQPGADAPQGSGQRAFAIGPTVGFWSGLGGIAGGGGETVKAWVSAGYMPVLVVANARTADKAVRLNYYGAYQLDGDLTLRVSRRARTEVGLLLGYKYNSVIGHGGGGGVRIVHDVSERVGLEISVGLALFPSAKDHLDRDHGYPADRVPVAPGLQGGANVGLLLFP